MKLDIELPDEVGAALEALAQARGRSKADVVQESLLLLEEHDREEQAKLERLRATAQEAFDALDRGEGLEFENIESLTSYVEQVTNEVVAERKRG